QRRGPPSRRGVVCVLAFVVALRPADQPRGGAQAARPRRQVADLAPQVGRAPIRGQRLGRQPGALQGLRRRPGESSVRKAVVRVVLHERRRGQVLLGGAPVLDQLGKAVCVLL